jgi:tetratricopeptide (TPR) repeat protein
MPLAAHAAPSVVDALKLTPVQRGIEYDTPEGDEVAKCTIKAEKIGNVTAWVVRGSNNEVLRQFADSNADNVVDIWSYFRDGLEVYRDVDSNNNGKADQYRWFHSNGIRWALDTNEDNTIDAWKLISPEEVAEEAVNALATKDAKRFERLLITAEDIKKLGLDETRTEQLQKRVAGAAEKFQTVAADPATAEMKFSDFGGTKPGMVPAGSQGVSRDLQVYESVWAMVQSGEEAKQMQLGTLISVNGAWKLIDGPSLGGGDNVIAGLFFDPGGRGRGELAPAELAGGVGAPSEQMQKVLDKLQELDEKLMATADNAEKAALNKQRAEYLLEVAAMVKDAEEREQWYMQAADSVSVATQAGNFPGGVEYLKELEATLAEEKVSEDLQAHVEFQRMLAEYYGVILADNKANIGEAQAAWMKSLEDFVTRHPQAEPAAEALRALAMGAEMSGKTDDAIKWYQRIVAEFPENQSATPLAKGAVNRLTSEGRQIAFEGTDLNGNKVNLADLRGKAVVIQYWTTSSDVCVADHAVLKELIAKYGGKSLEVISVNLDYDRDQLDEYLKNKPLPWKQLYSERGFDGKLANDMGVVTVPLNLLVGPDGKVISSNIQAAEVEGELKKLQVAALQGAGTNTK